MVGSYIALKKQWEHAACVFSSYLINAFREYSQIDTDRLIRKIGWLWQQAELADNTTIVRHCHHKLVAYSSNNLV